MDLIQYNQVQDVEEAEAGVMAGFRESGLVEGRDYVITVRNAQGDMATVSTLIDAALGERADLLVTFSTPTLQAALQRARHVPIVFTYVSSPQAAGAGKTDTDHLPNVTGVYMAPAYDDMIALIRRVMPSVKSLGTLFVPAEVNSVFNRNLLEAACRKAGLTLHRRARQHEQRRARCQPGAGGAAAGRDLPDSRQPHGGGVPDRAAGRLARAPADLRVPDAARRTAAPS